MIKILQSILVPFAMALRGIYKDGKLNVGNLVFSILVTIALLVGGYLEYSKADKGEQLKIDNAELIELLKSKEAREAIIGTPDGGLE